MGVGLPTRAAPLPGVANAPDALGGADAMQLLQTQKLTAAAPTIIFSNITQIYTHLFLTYTARCDYDASYVHVAGQINGDTNANYVREHIYGSGSSVKGNDDGTFPFARLSALTTAQSTANCPSCAVIWIPNYTNTTFFKLIVSKHGRFQELGNPPDNLSLNQAAIWQSTAAINQITLFPERGGNFVAGSTFSLYSLT